jgi:hypothetical protein
MLSTLAEARVLIGVVTTGVLKAAIIGRAAAWGHPKDGTAK